MVHIRRSINIISPLDGKHYDSLSKYEKSLDRAGCHIMEDKNYRNTRERLLDEASSRKENRKPIANHVHIDLNRDTITESYSKDVETKLEDI